MFSSLSIRDFRIYWLGTLISLIGTWIQIVAQSWLVFQLTNSAFLLGVVGFLSCIPIFLLSLFGGVAADRMDKRRILLFTQTGFMILALLLAFLTQVKLITTTQIMFIALLNGIVMAFDAPSRQAVVVELVGKEHLLNAIALNSAAFNSSRMIGPALAGILIAVIGMSGCFYINGISFLAVIVALLLIRVKNNIKKENKTMVLNSLMEGLRFIKNDHLVRILIIMVGVTSLFGIPYAIFMPIFAKDILKVGARGLAWLMAAAGVGAVIAALILAKLDDLKHKGRFLIVSSVIFSFSLIFFALSRTYLFSLFTLILVGWSSVTAISLVNTMLQTLVPDNVRGRVMSAFMFTFAGLMPFGNLIAGSLSELWGVSITVALGGAICGLIFLSINIFYPAIREV